VSGMGHIRGMKLPFNIFILIVITSTTRSLINLLATDGGEGSIAGILLSEGVSGVIFAFKLDLLR